jgi:capsular polysaccharide biosynthesis protein
MGSFSAYTALSIISSQRMREDIEKHFDLKSNPDFKLIDIIAYNTLPLTTEVKGTDPELVKDIANYCVSNVDRINAELNLSPEKPLLKVIDYAESGAPISNNKLKGIVCGALFALINGMFIFILKECFDKLYKKQRGPCGA